MPIKVKTPRECTKLVVETVTKLKRLIFRRLRLRGTALEKEIESVSSAIIDDLLMRICRKRPYRRVTRSVLISTVRTAFVEAVISILSEHNVDIRPIIKTFIREISASGVDIIILLNYVDTNKLVIHELIKHKVILEGLPLESYSYLSELAKAIAKNPREHSAYLILIYVYLTTYLELPSDILENIAYYISRIPSLFQQRILIRLSLPTLLKVTYQFIELCTTLTIAYFMQINETEFLNNIFQLMFLDKIHKDFIDTLHEYEILSDEEYEENITYIVHIQSILRDMNIVKNTVKFSSYVVKREREAVLGTWINRLRARVTETYGKYFVDINILYSKLYDVAYLSKTFIEEVMRVYYKFIRDTPVIKGKEKTFPFKGKMPFMLAYHVVTTIYTSLPEYQPIGFQTVST